MTTTTEQDETSRYALSAQDIRALRTADRLYYRYDRWDEVSQLEAIKEVSRDNAWEQRRTFPVHDKSVTWERAADGRSKRVARCGASILTSRWEPEPMDTLLELLRPGDELQARMVAGVYSQEAVERMGGHYVDELYLEILRTVGGKEKKLVFLVTVQAGLDNSARLCKTEPTPPVVG